MLSLLEYRVPLINPMSGHIRHVKWRLTKSDFTIHPGSSKIFEDPKKDS